MKRKQLNKKLPKIKLSKQEFEQLQEVWYQKLAESGFQDIERKNKHFMRRESTNIGLSYSKDTEDYYIKCRQFMFTDYYENLSSLEQDVWALYAEGFSYDKILINLNKCNNLTMLIKKKPYSRTKIQKIILKIKNIMLVSNYA